MSQSAARKSCVACTALFGAVALLGVPDLACTSAPTAFLVTGPGIPGNEPPTLTFVQPSDHVTLGRGDNFLIQWTDTDRDSNALITFILVNTVESSDAPTIVLVQDVPEDDTVGPDSFTVNTALIPLGTYNIQGIIIEEENEPEAPFALTTTGSVGQRITVTIVEPGQGPPTVPPIVAVVEPAFNLSVSQDDALQVVVQPTVLPPVQGQTPGFDPDSAVTMFIVLDMDLDPNNDDPANPDPAQIITLRQIVVAPDAFDAQTFNITIDLNQIPPRADGQPYFIRATVDDATNPRVHSYAVGTINVTELASGSVDLFEAGRTISGVRFYGFNPGANVGSSMSHIGDFDADGVADFVLVAQFGNPRNFGLIGEAYLIYGQPQRRFGGSLPVNSISEVIDGVIFEAPPVRTVQIPDSTAFTLGIADVSFIRDLTGDGRPEILFGLPHVHGALDTMDYDPGDTSITEADAGTDVTVEIRQGETRVTVGTEPTEVRFQYSGVEDLTISSAAPIAFTGSDADLTWQDAGAGQREWTLIKFKDVLNVIPDDPGNIDISSIDVSLRFTVFGTGGAGNLHRCLTNFNEQTTFATFAAGGGEPLGGTEGDANVDYVAEGTGGGEIGSVGGDAFETVDVDISDLVKQLVNRTLGEFGNELRFIIVPSDDDGEDRTAIRSSEATLNQDDRPTLIIGYTRDTGSGALNCYPDDLVNNLTTDLDDFYNDTYFYGGGMALVVNSQNRDNAGPIQLDRLSSTVVTLELVGQEGLILSGTGLAQGGGGLFPRADNSAEGVVGEPQQEVRIAGARFVAGPFDDIDARLLNQGAREGFFGSTVAALGDLNNDGVDEIMISSPRNERYLEDMFTNFGFQGTHVASTTFEGSITVLPGTNYNLTIWRDKDSADTGTAKLPFLDHHRIGPIFGRCGSQPEPRHQILPADTFEVFAEDVDDWLGGARSAGDFNQDGLDDILCGAPFNDRSSSLRDTGAVYVIYGRNVLGDFELRFADDPFLRPPMLRIRGVTPGDHIGWVQTSGLDVNGDRVDDVFFSSPATDFGGVARTTCAGDFNGDGAIDAADLDPFAFRSCEDIAALGGLFSDDACKVFDYNNDGVIDAEDDIVFSCLEDGGTTCCDNLADNGFIGIIFGGVFIDGDRTIRQLATDDLPGTIFYGAGVGHRAGVDVSSAGDFNQDQFGDILIAVPGETRLDRAGRERLGVVYLIFGGTHLRNTVWSLAQVGSADLPGIVFLSPFVKGRPNEAAPQTVAFLGDINQDGFGDIGIGNPLADFIDLSFPQGPDATDAEVGRRRDTGDVYIIYGNNFGSNRSIP